MTDFKAPPPPQGFAPEPQVRPEAITPTQPTPVAQEQVQPVADTKTNTMSSQAGLSSQQIQGKVAEIKNKYDALPPQKKNILLCVATFVLGIVMGCVMFGGAESVTQAPTGLQGVIGNSDIRPDQKLKRCGQAEASSACVLYVMNYYTYEKSAADFFELAASLTGRSISSIRTDNVRYASMKIPPGYFVQIKVPRYQ